MTGRRLLITGAAGFTGGHAAAYFNAAGAEVTAVVRQPKTSPPFPEGVKSYVCDLSNRKAVQTMIEEVQPDEVLHLAGKNSVPESWSDPLLYMETNVMATLYLLDALRGQPAGRILVAGSRLKFKPGGKAGPPHPYSLSKTIEELVSLSWGTLFHQPVLLAEPCNLIGPGPSTGFCSLLAQHMVRCEIAGTGEKPPPFKLSSRYALRDFLDVRDAVRAYDYILRQGEPGRVYRIDSGTQRELGEIAEKMLSHSVAAVSMDWGPAAAESLATGHGGPPHPESAPSLAASPSVRSASADKAVEAEESSEENVSVLGWRPEIGLARSLEDIVHYYRASMEGRLL